MTITLAPLPVVRSRLRAADSAVAALIVSFGSDRYLEAICAALTDAGALLALEERRHGVRLAESPL